MRKIVKWAFDIWWVYLIFIFIFLFAFILPNLNQALIVTDNQQITFRTELVHNWVLLGFRNLGIGLGCTTMGLFTFCVLAALYEWSHKE